jgi:large subunit ribosomal protein L31
MVVKQDMHPNYYTTQIVCGTCGTVWHIGSTKENLRVSICANCHPFYTGEQRQLVDTEGQVDRFMKRLAAAQQRQAEVAQRRESKGKKPAKKSLLSEIYGEETGSEGQQAAAPEAEAGTTTEE